MTGSNVPKRATRSSGPSRGAGPARGANGSRRTPSDARPARPEARGRAVQDGIVGDVEYELGVAIPGRILPPERRARTALKKLPPPGPLDWTALFGRTAPVILDLGCGNGRSVLGSAVRRPECDHFALDALPLVIRYATRRADQRGLHHVRFAVGNAEDLLAAYVAPGSVREIHVYHPQPYRVPGRDATELRLVCPAFLALVHRALEPGGLFVLQTDNAKYAAYMRRVVPAFFEWREQEGPWPDAPQGRTRREIVARRQGLRIHRGTGTPRVGLTEADLAELVRTLPAPAFEAE